MCYDFDAYLAKARIVEQLRTRKPVAGEREKERAVTTAPSAPAEPETRDKDRKPVPA